MNRLSNGIKSEILFFIFALFTTFVPHIVFANDPIASIGTPQPEKFAFLDNKTVVQVVPTHFQIVNTETGNIIDEFGSITDSYRVWLSEDGSHIANVNYFRDTNEYTLNVWDAIKRERINEWRIENTISFVSFSPTQPILAAAENDDIFIWNWQTGEKLGKMIGERLPTKTCFVVESERPGGKSTIRSW